MQMDWPHSYCRLGIARAEITPPTGIYHRMWGAARHDRAAGVHRPLTASALVFQPDETSPRDAMTPGRAELADSKKVSPAGDLADAENLAEAKKLAEAEMMAQRGKVTSRETVTGAGRVADRELPSPTRIQVLLAVDHCLLQGTEIERLVQTVHERSGVPSESVLVTFSHTHAAGLMTRDRGELPGGELIPAYLDQLNDTLAELVVRALEQSFDATLVYARASCSLAANRDFWDEDRQEIVCGFNPEAPADDALLVARVTDTEQRVRAVLVNYACHPTTLAWDNQLVSPDYPGAMRELVERDIGAPCVFIQGASGDLGPREGFVGDVEVADRNGRQVGYAVLSALASLPPAGTGFRYAGAVISGATIGTWRHESLDASRRDATSVWNVVRDTLALPYRSDLPSESEVLVELERREAEERAAREAGDTTRAGDCRAMVERQTRLLNRVRSLPSGRDFPFQVVLWRMGDAVWVGVQGEPYSQLQTELRARFPSATIVLATICNGWGPSYLVPRSSYDRGIYQEKVAVLAAGCLEQLTEQLAQRIARLLSDQAATKPTDVPASPVRNPSSSDRSP